MVINLWQLRLTNKNLIGAKQPFFAVFASAGSYWSARASVWLTAGEREREREREGSLWWAVLTEDMEEKRCSAQLIRNRGLFPGRSRSLLFQWKQHGCNVWWRKKTHTFFQEHVQKIQNTVQAPFSSVWTVSGYNICIRAPDLCV